MEHSLRPSQPANYQQIASADQSSGIEGSKTDTVYKTTCDQCVKSKIKCDGGKPMCKQCLFRKRTNTAPCQYSIKNKPGRKNIVREVPSRDLKDARNQTTCVGPSAIAKATKGEKRSWPEFIPIKAAGVQNSARVLKRQHVEGKSKQDLSAAEKECTIALVTMAHVQHVRDQLEV